MRKKLAVVGVLGLIIVGVGAVGMAVAAGSIPPKLVSSHVKPHTIKKAPFRFIVFGRVISPSTSQCQAGISGPYCYYYYHSGPIPCTGTMRVTIELTKNPYLAKEKHGIKVIKVSRTPLVSLGSGKACIYAKTIKISKLALTAYKHIPAGAPKRYEKVLLRFRYLGNSALRPTFGPRQNLRVKLINVK